MTHVVTPYDVKLVFVQKITLVLKKSTKNCCDQSCSFWLQYAQIVCWLGLRLRPHWWVFPKWAWSGSREQFLHRGLRKFRHSKSSVYRRYPQLVRGRFVYDTCRTMQATRSRHGWVHMFITHRPIVLTVTLQLHNFDLFRTCRRPTSSFCIVAWQLARFQLTRRIARYLGDSLSILIRSQTFVSAKDKLTEWLWRRSVSQFVEPGLEKSTFKKAFTFLVF